MNLKKLFSEIISNRFGYINEASLSRLLSRVQNNDFCIISGFRAGNTLNQNKSKNKEILQTINSAKMGGYLLIGHWQESPDGVEYNDATPDQLTDIVEESVLFVKSDQLDRDEFVSFSVQLCKKYNQDAIIIGLKDQGIFLYFKDGSSDRIGSKITLNKTSQAYSQMRKKANVPFVFEGTLSPVNNIGRQAFKQNNILY